MTVKRSPLIPRPVMRPKFRNELRGRLMAEALVVLAPRASRLSFSSLIRPAMAAAAILVLVFAGATTAAASSLPGDPLYAVKRATEDARVALTFDQAARLALFSELADRRLEELVAVARERPTAAPTATQQYADAADKVEKALGEAAGSNESNDNAIGEQGQNAEAAQAKRLATLDALKGSIPEDARPGFERLFQREKDRHAERPSAPPASDSAPEADKTTDDGGTKTTTTLRPSAPSPQRATPRATPRPTDSGEQNRDREGRD